MKINDFGKYNYYVERGRVAGGRRIEVRSEGLNEQPSTGARNVVRVVHIISSYYGAAVPIYD